MKLYHWFGSSSNLKKSINKKSRIHETKNLSTDMDSSTEPKKSCSVRQICKSFFFKSQTHFGKWGQKDV